MHASVPQPLTWIQRLTLAGSAALLFAVLAALVLSMYVAHQQTSGIVPAPAPVAPAAPVEPVPLPPTIVIPDNA